MKQLTLFLVFTTTVLFAQTESQVDAFAASYSFEQDQQYIQAADTLITIYEPSSYEINVRLGWLYFYAGEYDKALAYYQKASALLPYSIEAKLGLALPLSALGSWDEFESVMKDVLKTDPQNTLANYKLGLLYYNRAQYDQARQYIERVVNLYPFDYDSVILLAWINLKTEDYRKAKILFKKSLLIYPANESALEGLALIQ